MRRRWRAVLRGCVDAWLDQRVASRGAALAFYTLFSLTPILLLAVAIAGQVFGADAARSEIIDRVRELTGPGGALAIAALLAATRDPVSGALSALAASLLLLFGATSVFAELKASLDELWSCGVPRRSAFVVLLRTRLLAFALVLLLASLLVLSLLSGALLGLFEGWAQAVIGDLTNVLALAASAVAFALMAGTFAMVCMTLPEIPLAWADVRVGALVTAALFSLGKTVIGLYLGTGVAASGFGAAGSLIALLLWVYYSAQIFLVGAAFTHHYAVQFGSRRGVVAGPPSGDAGGRLRAG